MNILYLLAILLVTSLLSKRLVSPTSPPHNQLSPCKSVVFMSKDYTTILKGVAILLIMISHFSSLWEGGRFMTPLGGTGVALFLLASGYGLNESYKRSGLVHFWRKRMSKVYFPYAIAVLIFLPFKWSGWTNLVEQFTCLKCTYWFIPYILACYVLFWFVSRLFPKYRIELGGLLSIVSLLIVPELQAEQALSFWVGLLISEHKRKLTYLYEHPKSFMVLSFLFFMAGLAALILKQVPQVRAFEGTIVYHVVQLCIKLPLALALVTGLKYLWKGFSTPFVNYAGIISYELYLLHFPLYGYIGTAFYPAILILIFSLVVGYYFHKINGHIGKLIS